MPPLFAEGDQLIVIYVSDCDTITGVEGGSGTVADIIYASDERSDVPTILTALIAKPYI